MPASARSSTRDGDALERRPPRAARLAGGERSTLIARTDPSPGSNGGLWWNGTRFSQSRTACQWISAVTCMGISG